MMDNIRNSKKMYPMDNPCDPDIMNRFCHDDAGPLLSIVIPVYNVGSYLPYFFESLERQAFADGDVEFIFVNDGSTDNSLSLLNEFAAGHACCRIIDKKNAGQSAARNTGVSAALGKYIFMPDPDDVLAPESIMRLVRCLDDSDCRVLRFARVNVAEGGEHDFMSEHHGLPLQCRVVTKAGYLNETDGMKGVISACTLIISRKHMMDCDLMFDPMVTIWEDDLFNWKVVASVDSIMICDSVIYGYVQHASSQSNNKEPGYLRGKLPGIRRLLSGLNGLLADGDTDADVMTRRSIMRTIQSITLRLEVLMLSTGMLPAEKTGEWVDDLRSDGVFPLRSDFPFSVDEVRPHRHLYRILWIAQRYPSVLKAILMTLTKLLHRHGTASA